MRDLTVPGIDRGEPADVGSGQLRETSAIGHQGRSRTIAAQSGGISLEEHTPGTGGYHIEFPVNLGQRPIAATIHGGFGQTGQISATRCDTSPPGGEGCSFGNDPEHIFVKTANDAGAGADHKFIVTVLPE